ncbi:hypothetical protein N657DRAFT_578175 [Parathielavia appendiculata]|uniref:Major facilitator superfamily transporter n=1 Tax=Parathielavia appendiculata TaxID=2587402 RepID=A0AAN6TVK1_9PEZI|nr:hypothetical protein N657DRAFT_578175 [Parathielavia appendiculata]
MERSSSIVVKKSSSSISSLFSREDRPLLPRPAQQISRIRVRALLGNSLYRRVLFWTFGFLTLLGLALRLTEPRLLRERVHDLTEFHYNAKSRNDWGSGSRTVTVLTAGAEEPEVPPWSPDMLNWLRFRHLDGFFLGLKALVPASEYRPEHPRVSGEESPYPFTISYTGLPTPTPFIPQPDYESAKYRSQYHEVEPCYLDKDQKIRVPDIYAYQGIVQGQSEPIIGSHSLLGLRDDVCFDRFGRYGPYGLGYTFEAGGVEVGMDTEREGSEAVWAKTGKINYDNIDWADAQTRCYESNKQRFVNPYGSSEPVPAKLATRYGRPKHKHKITRTAVVIRAYTGYQWTHHALLNFRAMISELALRSGGEYGVHFLLHVRDDNEAIWADPATGQRILDENMPREFHGLCTLWSEDQMRLVYPGGFGNTFSNPSGQDIHGVYRSAHMPLQVFAMNHPEYEHFWNWELDMRVLGNYYELFDRLGKWGRQQSRVEAWERSAKYYIPRYHGSWDNFTRVVHDETKASGRPAVFGPVSFPGRVPLRSELGGQSFVPASCGRRTDQTRCGVGEDADLITLNPLFDAENSGWVFASDVTGYPIDQPIPPRRSSIITASRLSRRLLAVMHEETWRMRHAMFSEMFPATMALHHGLKAVYAPHPVWIDREWDLHAVDRAFNGGRDGSAGGPGSPFDLRNEHNHKGTSWYYNAEFAGLLWRRWLGYAQYDGRGPDGGRDGAGELRGGVKEEERADSTGRMCLRTMLVHPIKWEHPSEMEGYYKG